MKVKQTNKLEFHWHAILKVWFSFGHTLYNNMPKQNIKNNLLYLYAVGIFPDNNNFMKICNRILAVFVCSR